VSGLVILQEQASWTAPLSHEGTAHGRTGCPTQAHLMTPLMLVLAIWGLLSVLVVAGLCLLLHGRSRFNRAPRDAGSQREHTPGAGAHAAV
jgi:hypothetical protein